ncbi:MULTISPECIES: long-chain fatty acid--CoA ligase [Actinomycetes]|uniref:class I adenylate-forming enzyme family protein n=1 Tax=Actinomycetes TaxID=1760 RepID=UPI0018CC415A|nr:MULTISPECIES: long-chain fatty acid--CoA ligase [Actinomycetes]
MSDYVAEHSHIPPNSRHFLNDIMMRLVADEDQVVLSDDSRDYRGADLLALVARLAHMLASRGIGFGDRVALIAPTTGEAIAARYAAMCLGACTVFCPDAGSVDRLALFLRRIDADAALVFPDTAAAADAAAGITQTFGIGHVRTLPDLLAQSSSHAEARPPTLESADSDECVLVATGGTTGVSKASVRTVAQYTRLVALGPTPGRRQLICTPLAYIAQTLVDTVLMGGGHVVLRKHFDPAHILQTIEDEKITHLALVEPLLVDLLDSPAFPSYNLSTLSAISHVGADCAPTLRRRLLRRAGRPILVNPYGASEFGVISMLAGPDYSLDNPAHLGTAGTPLPLARVQIRDANGSACTAGDEGMICVQTPALASAYTVEPETSGFADDGWFCTGDIGVLDADGYLHVRGRQADRRTINEKGVFPVDIQDALCGHPDVRYAVALPDPHADNAFGAAIALHPGATATHTDLATHLERIAPALADTTLAITTAIPVTEQGKPDRRALPAIIWPKI